MPADPPTWDAGDPVANSSKPARSRFSTWLRALAFVGLALSTILVAVLAAAWLFDIDLTNEVDRAIEDYASQHRRTDLRFPGADYTTVKSIPMMSDQFDMSASALSLVESELNERLSENPGDFDTLFAMAKVHLLHSRFSPALDILERLHPFHREDPALLGILAYGYYLRGRRENRTQDLLRSIDLLEKALTFAPEDPVLLFNLGTACERARIRRQARETYRHYLAIDPDSAWAAELKGRLFALDDSGK